MPKCSALREEEHEATLLQLAEDQKLLAQPVSTESSGKFDRWAARASIVFIGGVATVLSGGALAPAAALLYRDTEIGAQVHKASG